MNNRHDLNPYETNAVLDFFMYYLPMEQRRKLMHEMPVIYNKLVGRKVMATVNIARIEDGDEPKTIGGIVEQLLDKQRIEAEAVSETSSSDV